MSGNYKRTKRSTKLVAIYLILHQKWSLLKDIRMMLIFGDLEFVHIVYSLEVFLFRAIRLKKFILKSSIKSWSMRFLSFYTHFYKKILQRERPFSNWKRRLSSVKFSGKSFGNKLFLPHINQIQAVGKAISHQSFNYGRLIDPFFQIYYHHISWKWFILKTDLYLNFA